MVTFWTGSASGMAVHHHRVTGLVIGNDALLFVTDQAGLAFRSHHNALDGFFQFRLADGLLVAAGSQDGGFVDQVFQVSAHKTGCAARHGSQVHGRIKRLALDMDFQDGLAPFTCRGGRGSRGGQNDRGAAGPDREYRDGWWRP